MRISDVGSIDRLADSIHQTLHSTPDIFSDTSSIFEQESKVEMRKPQKKQKEKILKPKQMLQDGQHQLGKVDEMLFHPQNSLAQEYRQEAEQAAHELRIISRELQSNYRTINNPLLTLTGNIYTPHKRLIDKTRRFMEESRSLRRIVFERSKTSLNQAQKSEIASLVAQVLGEPSGTSSRASFTTDTDVSEIIKDFIQRTKRSDAEAWARDSEEARLEGRKLCANCGARKLPEALQYEFVSIDDKPPSSQPLCKDVCLSVLVGLPNVLSSEELDKIRGTLPYDDLFQMIQDAVVNYYYNEGDVPKLVHNLMTYKNQILDILNTLVQFIRHPTVFSQDSYRSVRCSLRRLLSKCIKTCNKETGQYIYPQSYVFDSIRWSDAHRLPEAGEGSHGTIFALNYTDNPLWKRMLAVKVPRANIKDKRMVYEFLIQWSLKHRNILELYGTAEFLRDTDGYTPQQSTRQSLLMPLKIHGCTRDYIHAKTVAGEFDNPTQHLVLKKRIHKWVNGIVAGLAYLHSENIVHGDLRGRNIMIDDDQETTLLTDFGLSVFADGMSGNHDSKRYGNYLWQPIEILQREDKVRPTKWSDIYFFGGVLIELYTGHDPYYLGPGDPDGERSEYPSRPTILKGLQQNPPVYPDRPNFHSSKSTEMMNGDLWNLVRRECWKMDSSQRPTAEQLVEMVDGIINLIIS